MLDAETDGERFGFEEHATFVQHEEGVARAVAQRHHHMVGAQCAAVGQHHATHASRTRRIGFHLHIVDPVRETDLTAQRFNVGAHVLHHRHQAEGSDVRLADVEDFLRRAGLDEFGQHLASVVALVADLAVQLAVRERARAAFAELHVGFGVEDLLPPQAEGIHGALAHVLATLQDDRFQAHLRKDQSGKQAAWPHADDQWPQCLFGQELGHEPVSRVRRRPDLAIHRFIVHLQARQDVGFARGVHVNRIDQGDRPALARVIAALGDGEAGQLIGGDAQPRHDGRRQRGFVMVQGKFEVGKSEHGHAYRDAPF